MLARRNVHNKLALDDLSKFYELQGKTMLKLEDVKPVSYTHLTLPTNREV